MLKQNLVARTPEAVKVFEMEVLCASDERFLPHTATMLCSLLNHNRICRIHLFYGSDATRGLPILKAFVENKYETQLLCYEIEPQNGLRVDGHMSIATYYRLMAPRILSIDIKKILYLDSDIIVRRSLTDLWTTDLRDHALAAVQEFYWDQRKPFVEIPPGSKYFNAGILLINLDYWRRNKIGERAIDFIINNPQKVNYWDQDALNALLVNRWINLPPIWNVQVNRWSDLEWIDLPTILNVYDDTEARKLVANAAIVHFVGPVKPWHWRWHQSNRKYPLKSEYHRYRRKTPWRQYRLEGKPSLLLRLYFSVGSFAKLLLPGSVRRWVRSYMPSPQI